MVLRFYNSVVDGATVTFASGDSIVVARAGGIMTTGPTSVALTSFIAANGLDVFVEGIVAGGSGGIQLGGNVVQVVIAGSGSVFGGGFGIALNGPGNEITNHGTIRGAVSTNDERGRITNTGDISANGQAVYQTGDRSYLHNSGTIAGAVDPGNTLESAVRQENFPSQIAWMVNDGTITGFNWAYRGGAGANYVVNNGRIEGNIDFGGGTTGERFINTGSVFGSVQGMGTGGSVVENSGSILTQLTMTAGADNVVNSGYIYQLAFGGGSGDRLVNSGEIGFQVSGSGDNGFVRNSGEINALAMGIGTDVVINKGTIGSLFMGSAGGFDRLVNKGLMTGLVSGFGSFGADVTNAGHMTGQLLLGNGNDVVRNSGTLRDVVLGNGNDTYLTLGAGHAEGSIDGGVGNDRLIGGDEADLLLGGGGNDTLRGGGDADVIQGGAGADTVRGDEGADVFVFASASELRTTGPFDLIRDFTRDEDVIDLSQMPGALVFNGTGAFSGGGTRSVTYSVTGTTTTVRVDADGDGVSDGSILLNKITVLSAADFLL